MNLTAWAQAQGIQVTTAYRWYREGRRPVSVQKVGRLILVCPETASSAGGVGGGVGRYARVSWHDAHAVDLALAYDRLAGDAPVDRLVVTLLRHEFTSYDTDPTRAARRVVGDGIAARFRWLRPECDRQVQVRARRKAEERRFADERATAWAAEKVGLQARVEQSKRAIGQFGEGMQVTAKVKGYARDVSVLRVGRSRLTIGFMIKSGADRTAHVYARDVQQ